MKYSMSDVYIDFYIDRMLKCYCLGMLDSLKDISLKFFLFLVTC